MVEIKALLRSVAVVVRRQEDWVRHEIDLWICDCGAGREGQVFSFVEEVIMAAASDQSVVHCKVLPGSIIRSIEETDGWYTPISGHGVRIRTFSWPIELVHLLSVTLIEIQDLHGNSRRLKDGLYTCMQANVVDLNRVWLDVGAAVLINAQAYHEGYKALWPCLHPSTSNELEAVRLPVSRPNSLQKLTRKCIMMPLQTLGSLKLDSNAAPS